MVADSLAAVPRVRQRITQAGYANSTPETLIANVQRYVHVVEIVLGGIGLIGLIIAALGISNAMLATVHERRREIGVMKAIGARDRDVRRVFLLEASFLGALGGAVGTFLGWGIARTLAAVVNNFLHGQGLAGVGVNLPLRVFAIGVFGAGALALVAGTIPAACPPARLPARQAMGDRSAAGVGRPVSRSWRSVCCVPWWARSCGSGSGSGSGGGSNASAGSSVPRHRPAGAADVRGDRRLGRTAPLDDPIPVGQTWPQFFFRDAAQPQHRVRQSLTQVASAHTALQVELPLARQLHPTVAAILIGFVDVDEGDPPADFGGRSTRSSPGLRAAGVHTVLMGTLPDAIHGVASYNEQIADVADNDAAVLVDLSALHLTFVHNSNDFTPVPDRTSQRAIGDVFTTTYRAVGGGDRSSPGARDE